jgi:hypothetical protein
VSRYDYEMQLGRIRSVPAWRERHIARNLASIVCLLAGLLLFALGTHVSRTTDVAAHGLAAPAFWLAMAGGVSLVIGLLGLSLRHRVSGEHR